MLNGRRYLQAGLYHIGGRFSSIGSFLNYFGTQLDQCDYSLESITPYLDYYLTDEYLDKSKNEKEFVLRYLMREDLQEVKTIFNNTELKKQIDSELNINDQLELTLDKAICILRDIGLSFDRPNIFIVDQFPSPYESLHGFALNADYGDHIEHGIEQGIYFLRSGLRPIYSRYLLLHELIHTILGQKNPELLACGLEEGICELVGSIYLSNKILGKNLTKNIFVYNRLYEGESSPLDLYLDYTRQAALVYKFYGWDGLFEILLNGRYLLKKIEIDMWKGKTTNLNLKGGCIDYDSSSQIDFLLNVVSRNLICSPTALYVARYTQTGDSIKEIAHKCKLSEKEALSGISELENYFRFLVLRADKAVVSFADCESISETPLKLRYSVRIS